jgi:hypothetical protein
MLISLLLNDVYGVIQGEEAVACHVTPGRDVDLCPLVVYDNLDSFTDVQSGERALQSDSKLAAADFAGYPPSIDVLIRFATHLYCPLKSPLKG